MSVFLTVEIGDDHAAELDIIIDNLPAGARIRTEVLSGFRVRAQCSGLDVDTAAALLELHRKSPVDLTPASCQRWALDYVERRYAGLQPYAAAGIR